MTIASVLICINSALYKQRQNSNFTEQPRKLDTYIQSSPLMNSACNSLLDQKKCGLKDNSSSDFHLKNVYYSL